MGKVQSLGYIKNACYIHARPLIRAPRLDSRIGPIATNTFADTSYFPYKITITIQYKNPRKTAQTKFTIAHLYLLAPTKSSHRQMLSFYHVFINIWIFYTHISHSIYAVQKIIHSTTSICGLVLFNVSDVVRCIHTYLEKCTQLMCSSVRVKKLN